MPRHFDSHAERPLHDPPPRLVPLDRAHFCLPRRSTGGCARRTRPPRPPHARSGCRTPCPGTGAAPPRRGRAARPRSPRSSPSSSFCSTTLAPAITTPSGPPSPSVSRLFLVPFLPAVGGVLARLFPPNRALPSIASAALPLPLHPAEFVALGDQHRPDLLEDAALRPSAGTSRGRCSWGRTRSGSWSHWQPLRIRKMIPLSVLRQWAARRPVGFLGQNSLRIGSIRSPQLVGDLPDRAQRLAASLAAGHGCGSRGDGRWLCRIAG